MGDKVSLIPLGGMSRVGERNCHLIIYGSDALMLDCGQRIPSEKFNAGEAERELSSEYVPDFSPIFDQGLDLRGILISHGHLDHAGAVRSFFTAYEQAYPDKKAPAVYGSGFTQSVIENIIYRGLSPLPTIRNLVWSRPQEIGPFVVQALPVIHSIPGSSGFLVKVGGKHILYLGDCKTLGEDREEEKFWAAMRAVQREGVDMLLLDSTNAHERGYAPRERIVLDRIRDVMESRRKSRLMIASFSSHLKRLRFIINLAGRQKRHVFVLGASLSRYLQAAGITQGWRNYWGKRYGSGMVYYSDVPEDAIILATGAQAEEGSALPRVLNGDIPLPWNEHRDAIMIAASTIPLPEIQVRVGDMVRRAHEYSETLYLAHGVASDDKYGNVVRDSFHVSGHGMQDDLYDILTIARAKIVVPVHADRSRRRIVQDLAPHNSPVELLEEGGCLTL